MSLTRWWGGSGVRIDFEDDYGVNVSLPCGVVVQLARNENDSLEVWGVEIDGVLYREPRDLSGEPLQPGPFADLISRADKESV